MDWHSQGQQSRLIQQTFSQPYSIVKLSKSTVATTMAGGYGAQLGAWCPDGRHAAPCSEATHGGIPQSRSLQGTQGLYLGGLVRARLMVNDGQLH